MLPVFLFFMIFEVSLVEKVNAISAPEMFSTYGSPIVYHSEDDEIPPKPILEDLKNAGYEINDDNIISLSNYKMNRLTDEIPGVSLPFIYFPVETKVHWRRVGVTGFGAAAAIVGAPFVLGAAVFEAAGVQGGIAAGFQAAFNGGAAGGIFDNIVIGLRYARIGYGADYMASSKDNPKVTTIVEAKWIGLYRRENEVDDRNAIARYIINKLGIEINSGESQIYRKEIGKILGNQMKEEVLPGLIVYFHTTPTKPKN